MQHQTIRRSFLAAAAAAGLISTAQAAPPENSAYSTDSQTSYVEDATSKGIGQVNMITCIMASLRPEALVNEDAYLALVNDVKCDSQSRSSSSNSGAGGDATQAAQYMTATVLSSRASNDDPMIMKAWLDNSEPDMKATIFVHDSLTAPASAQNPYGEFRLDFCGKAEGQSACMMQGFLEGGEGSLSFFQKEDESFTALQLASVGTTSGSGELRTTETKEGVTQTQQVLFAYDESHFLRDNQCFSRDAGDPDTGMSVWRYGVYDATSGERVERASGFPFEFTAEGNVHHGYIGYWGMSLAPDAAGMIADDQTVQRVEYGDGEEPTRTDYTIARSPGKLMKYTRQSRSLAAMDHIPFETWVGDVAGFYPDAQPDTQYVMYWDQANAVIKVTGLVSCDDNGCQSHDLESEQSVPLSFWSSQNGIQGHSRALGGELFIDLQGVASPIDAAAVTVVNRVEALAYPDEMPTTLYCLRDCPSAATLQSFFSGGSEATSPFVPATYNMWGPTGNAVTYAIDAGSGVLKDAGGNAVALTDPEAFESNAAYQSGVRTGRLFTDLAAAECAVGSGDYCDSKVSTLDVYYAWETGPNSWNQFAAVRDSAGELVRFEAPLRLNFAVPADNAHFGQYAGKSIVLEYGGFGELSGIPGNCVSHLTNEAVSCDDANARYVPEFVIPFDVDTGRVTSGDNVYLVKWLEREIRFASKDPAACSALALPANVVLPGLDDVLDPTDPDSAAYIGAAPQVDAAPRVVDGNVKY